MRKLILSILFVLAIYVVQSQCTEVFISEYVHAIGNNRAIELYNPTGSTVDLSEYRVVRWSNGADVYDDNYMFQFNESAFVDAPNGITIPAKGTFVFATDKRDPNATGFDSPLDLELQAKVDAFVTPSYGDRPTLNKCFYHNGNDAYTLEKKVGNDWVVIDVFAVVGGGGDVDGITGWTDDPTHNFLDSAGIKPYSGYTWTTRRRVLIRKPAIESGVTFAPIALPGAAIASTTLPTTPHTAPGFDVSIQWAPQPIDVIYDTTYMDSLGAHNCVCNSQASTITELNTLDFEITPNPTSDQITISSLDPVNRVILSSIRGEQLMIRNVKDPSRPVQISLDNYAKGAYLITVFDEKRQTTQTVVVR